MTRKEFIKQLLKVGCILLRSGVKHDVYYNPSTNKKQPMPRHPEIDNNLVKHI